MELVGYARVSSREERQVFDRQVDALRAAGCERVFLWPLGDERRQLELVASEVVPMIRGLTAPGPAPPRAGTRASR